MCRLVVQLDEGVRVARGAAREGRALLLGGGDVLRLPVAAAVERERCARLLADLLVRVRVRVGDPDPNPNPNQGSLARTLYLTVTLTLANPKAWNMELEAGFG